MMHPDSLSAMQALPVYSAVYVDNLNNIIEMHRFNINTLLWVGAIIVAVLGVLNIVNVYFSFNFMLKTKKEISSVMKKNLFLIDFLDFVTEDLNIGSEYRATLAHKMLDMIIRDKKLFKEDMMAKITLLIALMIEKHKLSSISDSKNDWAFVNTHFTAFKIDRIRHIYNDPAIDRIFNVYVTAFPSILKRTSKGSHESY